jgi:hypothetical protein
MAVDHQVACIAALRFTMAFLDAGAFSRTDPAVGLRTVDSGGSGCGHCNWYPELLCDPEIVI